MSSSSSLSRLWSVSTVCSVFLESVILESSVFGNETMTNILKTQTTIARSKKEHCKTEKTSGPLRATTKRQTNCTLTVEDVLSENDSNDINVYRNGSK